MKILLLLSCCIITIFAYVVSRKVAIKYPSPLTTPVFLATAIIIIIFLSVGITIEDYEPAKKVLTFLLGPATVALAVPSYRNRHIFKQYWKAICSGLIIGTISSILTAVGILTLFSLSKVFITSISVKSVTVPIALEISNVLHGDQAITTFFVMFTGISGAMFGPVFLNLFRVKNPLARGLSLGTMSHGLGTSTATQEGELQGAVSAVAMGLTAVFTSFIAPFIF